MLRNRGRDWLEGILWDEEDVVFATGISASVHIFTLGVTIFFQILFWTAWYPHEDFGDFERNAEFTWIAILLSFFIAPVGAWWWCRAEQLNSIYAVTTHRLLIRHGGYLGVEAIGIPWNQIASVVVEQSWYDAQFDRGKLRISDTGQQQWEFNEVNRASLLKQHILDAVTPRAT